MPSRNNKKIKLENVISLSHQCPLQLIASRAAHKNHGMTIETPTMLNYERLPLRSREKGETELREISRRRRTGELEGSSLAAAEVLALRPDADASSSIAAAARPTWRPNPEASSAVVAFANPATHPMNP